jgi:ABC-2 type transport system ATP-binding protein
MKPAPAIEVLNLVKAFPKRRGLKGMLLHPFTPEREKVLNALSMAVPENSSCALLGPNGAGKSTLLRILAGLITPDSGTVRVLGVDALALGYRLNERVGLVVGDERSFYARLTAGQNLRFYAALHGLSGASLDERVERALGMLDLREQAGKMFSDLSSGMKQRLALARVMLADPAVLLFDEITKGLDPGQARRFRRLLREELGGTMKKTVVFATHNIEEAGELADMVVLLDKGRTVSAGSMDEARPHFERIFGSDGEDAC